MKAYEIQSQFGLDNLRLTERPDPSPGPGEVLVGVRACSLNYRDLMTVLGTYNPKQKLPLVPCSDGAGEVLAVGSGVRRFKPGDRVASTFSQTWLAGPPSGAARKGTLGGPMDGMLRELAVLSEEGLVALPDYLTFEEGACLPCAGLTAWNALFGGETPLKPGDTVLVEGTGGVSIFALQFARMAGARVIVSSSSDEKLSRAKALGAWATINYSWEPEWDRGVLELTGGEGVDHVVEVGGAGTFEKALKAVRIGGSVSVIGVLTGAKTEVALTWILMKSLHLRGLFVGSRSLFEEMNRAVGGHHLKPVVDKVFPFEQAGEAFRLMQKGGHFGKIVVGVGK
ncbi:MAG: NAD(P)-dependent alcohol dehydrogenase [Acidobacteriota bacterium]